MTLIRRKTRRLNWSGIGASILAVVAVLGLLALLVGLPGHVGYREIEDLRQEQNAYRGYDPTIDGVHLRGAAPAFPEAEHEKPRENRATCNSPYSREDADLCAQWAAVKAVTIGNGIAITGLRSTLSGTLVTAIGILLTAVGLVIATLASRDATRAVRAMENLERGYLNVEVTGAVAGKIGLKLINIGRTPVWIGSVVEHARGIIHDRNADGLRCVPAADTYEVAVVPAAGINPRIVNIAIQFNDVCNQLRTLEAALKMSGKGVWRLAELYEHESK